MSPWLRRIFVRVVAAVAVLGLSAPAKAWRPTETVLYSFCSQQGCPDGGFSDGLIQGSDGNFYGVGGSTLSQLTLSGTLTTIHLVCPQGGDCPDGFGPGALIEGSDGNFYGIGGGGNMAPNGGPAGTVFMLTPSGTLTTLYAFCAQVDPQTKNCLDGEYPNGVIQDSDGNFYGTIFEGGPNAFGGAQPAGVVFKLTPSGVLTPLYSFCSQYDLKTATCVDGQVPGSLIEGSDGNFYGITSAGGQFSGGTVFMLTPSGTFTTLHSFCQQKRPFSDVCLDGDGPSVLIQGSDGSVYGTTYGGGENNEGSAFKVTPSGTFTSLYSFCRRYNRRIGCLDGAGPGGLNPKPGTLIEGSDGNFYGLTGGGANDSGTVFKLTPSGRLTTLYSFCSEMNPESVTDCLDGAHPVDIIEGSDGNLYGVTSEGGLVNSVFGFGTVFKLALSPETLPANLTISPARYSFGKTPVGTTRQKSFVVRARSQGNSANPVVLESFNAGVRSYDNPYSVDPMLTTCQEGQTLQPNQQCEIVVDFSPFDTLPLWNDNGGIFVISNSKELSPKNGLVRLRGVGEER